MRLKTKTAFETRAIGQKLAEKVKNGGVIALYGRLGAGKTTLVQGLAKGLGINQRIVSPTFIIIRRYNHFWHIDLYRIDDVSNLGIEEILSDKKNIVAIEWPDKIEKILPPGTLKIYLDR